jgi:signal transduction histidine kinase
VYIKVDEEKFSWALVQLVDNAIKFTPPEGKVTLAAESRDGILHLAVIDTGIGIPEDRMAELFATRRIVNAPLRRHGPGSIPGAANHRSTWVEYPCSFHGREGIAV